jgi:hypothetical protein
VKHTSQWLSNRVRKNLEETRYEWFTPANIERLPDGAIGGAERSFRLTPASIDTEKLTAIVVEMMLNRSETIRDLTAPPQITAEYLIERYYRIKAQGGKVTLKQLAEKYGFNHSYLRTVKTEYDKAGGWGAKRNTNTTPPPSDS